MLRARVRQGVFICAFLFVLLGWGGTYATTWPGFHPHGVTIEGTRVVNPQAVRLAAHIDADANIWLLNPWKIERDIEAIPYVDIAQLHRRLPNLVRIVVTERHPESCVQTAQNLMTIDATQRVLEGGCKASLIYDVPKISAYRPGTTLDDPNLGRLRSTAALLGGAAMRVKRMSLDVDEGIVAERFDGVRLLLGDDIDMVKKIRLVAPILAAARSHDPNVELIDLRAVDTPVVRYRESQHGMENPPAK